MSSSNTSTEPKGGRYKWNRSQYEFILNHGGSIADIIKDFKAGFGMELKEGQVRTILHVYGPPKPMPALYMGTYTQQHLQWIVDRKQIFADKVATEFNERFDLNRPITGRTVRQITETFGTPRELPNHNVVGFGNRAQAAKPGQTVFPGRLPSVPTSSVPRQEPRLGPRPTALNELRSVAQQALGIAAPCQYPLQSTATQQVLTPSGLSYPGYVYHGSLEPANVSPQVGQQPSRWQTTYGGQSQNEYEGFEPHGWGRSPPRTRVEQPAGQQSVYPPTSDQYSPTQTNAKQQGPVDQDSYHDQGCDYSQHGYSTTAYGQRVYDPADQHIYGHQLGDQQDRQQWGYGQASQYQQDYTQHPYEERATYYTGQPSTPGGQDRLPEIDPRLERFEPPRSDHTTPERARSGQHTAPPSGELRSSGHATPGSGSSQAQKHHQQDRRSQVGSGQHSTPGSGSRRAGDSTTPGSAPSNGRGQPDDPTSGRQGR